MTENNLEVSVKYDNGLAKLGLIAVMLLSPVWGIVAPLAVAFAIVIFCVSFSTTQLANEGLKFLSMALGFLLVFTAGAAATIFVADNRIRISRDAIRFPQFLMRFPSCRRKFAWSEVNKIDLVNGDDEERARLVFYVQGEWPIKLSVRCLDKDMLEQMILAVEVWGHGSEVSPELLQMKEKLSELPDSESSQPSYTAMWEAELARRFAATAFAPLEPESSLQSGRIKIVKQLSFGGLSAIYLCQVSGTNLAVLKEAVIPSGTKDGVKEKALEHFQREAALLMKLKHAAIVQVLDHFVEAGRTYLLLEYLNGQDLRQFVLQNGPLNDWMALSFGIQIATVLDYLHHQEPPLIHRDISPDNVVRNEDDTLTLIDFGAANEFVGNATGTLVGKQCFIAPEQFRGKAVTQSDLYALGCTLFFLLTGEEPEALSTSHPKELRADLSLEIDELVADLTEMELGDRIESATAARLRMEAILSGRTAAA